MTSRLKRLSISALAVFLAMSMFPAYAFAYTIASESGPVSEISVAGNNYAAYTSLELHSDTYMNGFSNILCNVRTPAGGYKATSYLYWVNDVQEPWLMATTSSTNSASVAPGFFWSNQVWAPYSMTWAYRCQSANWINYSGGSHGFNTQAQMAWNPGWPLPFSGDAESSLTELSTPIATNDTGLTYGPSQNLDNPEGQPDLVGVVASNGELGYVYYEDLYAVSVGDLPTMSAEEALQRNEERNAHMASALKDAAAELCGTEALTEQDALEGLALLDETADIDKVAHLMDGKIKQNTGTSVVSDLSEEVVGIDEFLSLMDSAKNEVGIYLPVYAQDGVTQIGEFSVLAL